ncbi:MAG: AraC family transcriptional regulator, partial [Terriglobales bacterium]
SHLIAWHRLEAHACAGDCCIMMRARRCACNAGSSGASGPDTGRHPRHRQPPAASLYKREGAPSFGANVTRSEPLRRLVAGSRGEPERSRWEQAPYLARCERGGCATKNLVLTGATTRCHVPRFSDPISIKTVCKGEVEWRLDGQRYLIHPDTYLLLPDGDEYELTIDSIAPSRGFNVLFRRGLVEDCWRTAVAEQDALLDAPFELQSVPFGRSLGCRSSRLGLALDALVAAVARGASLDAVESLFEALGASAARTICEQRGESLRPTAVRSTTRLEIYRRLCRARDTVEDDLTAPWTLSTMSRAATMALHHFHRSFHVTFQETPRAWLTRRRTERAMALLRTTTRSVTEICLAVGYLSPSSFSTSFARRYGIAPSKVPRPAAARLRW